MLMGGAKNFDMALVRPLIFFASPSHLPLSHPKHHIRKHIFRVSCLSARPEPVRFFSSASNFYPQLNLFLNFIVSVPFFQIKATETNSLPEYQPGMLDNLLLTFFRNKMVQEVGWDSEKPGYNGLIEVANRLMVGRSNSDTKEAAVRVIKSLFPAWLIDLFRIVFAPLQGGEVAAVMVAWATASSCQWLMGSCKVNSVNLPNGSSWMSGVFVQRCKYLEESKCLGICINTCKLPTQTFFKDYMGVPLMMEPNFSDYSCQFNFGVLPPLPEDDSILKEPCLEICPNARRRKEITSNLEAVKCPKS